MRLFLIFTATLIFTAVTSCTPDEVKVSTVCGDGKIQGLEQCDDGNLVSGDGCDVNCNIEYTEICNNNQDDDLNGFIDCLDPQCAESEYCQGEICSNGYDDDENGLTDCNDPQCALSPWCVEPEDCTDGKDNDLDGNTDCDDVLCQNHPICGGCDPSLRITDEIAPGFSTSVTIEAGTQSILNNCDISSGSFSTLAFHASEAISIEIISDEEVSDVAVQLLREEEHDVSCMWDYLDCMKVTQDSTVLFVKNPLPPGYYRLAISSDTQLHITLKATEPMLEICNNNWDDDGDLLVDCEDPDCETLAVCSDEICDNSIDDDGDSLVDCEDPDCLTQCAPPEICGTSTDEDLDGYIDCEDPDCLGDSYCTEGECIYYAFLGVLGRGSEVVHTFSTESTTNRFSTSCGGTGSDYVVAFETSEYINIQITMAQTGYHALSLAQRSPGNCDKGVFHCVEPQGINMPLTLTEHNIPPGKYYIIADALTDQGSGTGSFTVKITSPLDELCANNEDDDGDGLADCDDPDCAESQFCAGESYCHDDIDNDLDGYTDCSDPDCNLTDACITSGCTETTFLGELTHLSPIGYTVDFNQFEEDFETPCTPLNMSNTGRTFTFNLSQSGRIRLKLLPENFSEGAMELGFGAGGTDCMISPYMCITQSAPGIGSTVTTSHELTAGGPYFLRIMPYISGNSGGAQLIIQYEE
ncbi:MAG: DUF4215 domain-containing protein [Deltaproteobacteria bacterium]|nr:DUF4215 domain-containing protein [Deltaproteobacteria bacterium]